MWPLEATITWICVWGGVLPKILGILGGAACGAALALGDRSWGVEGRQRKLRPPEMGVTQVPSVLPAPCGLEPDLGCSGA